MRRIITDERLEQFRAALYEDEKEANTINKYIRDLKKFVVFLQGSEVSKEMAIRYKEYLKNCGEYKVSSINSFLAALNHFCEFMGWYDVRLKTLKIQREAFCPEKNYLSKEEYRKLVWMAASTGKRRLAMIMQTLAGTGVRVSEIRFFTVDVLKKGAVEIYNKSKLRKILLPKDLQSELKKYVKDQNIKEGPIFKTKTGNLVDRSNIWREMKELCKAAGIDGDKVFPHNFRHLFARCFYRIKRDIVALADVLGHSNVETSRVYIKSTGEEHRRQLDAMRMVERVYT